MLVANRIGLLHSEQEKVLKKIKDAKQMEKKLKKIRKEKEQRLAQVLRSHNSIANFIDGTIRAR